METLKKNNRNMVGLKRGKAVSQTTALLCEIGIVLVMVGMHLGTVIRNLIPSVDPVNLFMLFSAVLIFCGFKFSAFNTFPHKTALFLLIIYHAVMAVLSQVYARNSAHYNISCTAYHLYVPVLALCLISARHCKINTTRLLRIMFYITGFIAVALITYSVPTGSSVSDISGRLVLEEGGDPIALPRAMIIYFITQLLYKSKNLFELGMKVLFSFCAIVNLLAFNTRAVYIGLILVLIIGVVKKGKIETRTRNEIMATLVMVILIVLAAIVLYFTNKTFSARIDSIVENTQRGILTYFGNNEMGSDMSTSYRYQISRTIFSDMARDFSLTAVLFGFADYMTYYVDIPILQSVYDTGFLFGSIYFFFTFFIPVKHLFFYKNKLTQYQLFVTLFSFQYLLDQFYCGLPYTYYMWTPGLLVWVAFADTNDAEKKKKKAPRYVSKYVKIHTAR